MSGRHKLWLLAAAVALLLVPALACAQDRILEIDLAPGEPEPIPPNCTGWHELWPSFCTAAHQDSLDDNGDGMLSVDDVIILDLMPYHVDWVGPTYTLDCDIQVQPTDYQDGDPAGQTWIEMAPNYGELWQIDEWADNGNGAVDICDNLVMTGGVAGETLICHIDDISTSIHVTMVTTPVEHGSWSRFKSLFGM